LELDKLNKTALLFAEKRPVFIVFDGTARIWINDLAGKGLLPAQLSSRDSGGDLNGEIHFLRLDQVNTDRTIA